MSAIHGGEVSVVKSVVQALSRGEVPSLGKALPD